MTPITNSNVQIYPNCFHSKNYKGFKVFGEFLKQNICALALLVASVASCVFNRDVAATCFSRAKIYFNRASMTLMTYFKFNKELIEFSYNSRVSTPPSSIEKNVLYAQYGSTAINRWLQIGKAGISLKQEKLKHVEEGICLGMSLDFIQQYLQKIRVNVSPTETICKISQRYMTGSPEEAQLTQIFYSALDSTQILEKEKVLEKIFIKEKGQEVVQWLEKEKKQIPILSDTEVLQRIDQIEIQADEKKKALKHLFRSRLLLAESRVEAQRVAIIGDQLGLKITLARTYDYGEIPANYEVEFVRLLEELAEGCYLGSFFSEKTSHAVSLIKANNQYFLFDPNFGTLILEKNTIAPKLWDIGKNFYLKNGGGCLSFSSCSLSE